jgi:hypothetical protein
MRGMKKALDQFAALPEVYQARCATALTLTATYVRDRARMFCPVGYPPFDLHGGDLRSAIAFKVIGTMAVVGIELRKFARGGRNAAHQWPSTYGPWVEFGHYAGRSAAHARVARVRRSRGGFPATAQGRRFVPAQPFMRPAAEVGRVEFPREMERAAQLAEGDLIRSAD